MTDSKTKLANQSCSYCPDRNRADELSDRIITGKTKEPLILLLLDKDNYTMIDLKIEMSKLPEPITEDKPPLWSFWRNQLWHLAQTQPAESFLSWPCVRHTMLHRHWPNMVQREQDEMLHVSGNIPDISAPAFPLYTLEQEQANLRQAYHLWKWEQVTGKKISSLETIVEVGGGYGAACLMAYRMGFKGKYVIFDLPEFGLLQQWYLDVAGVEGVEFITELPKVEHSSTENQVDLLIAIYSMSEMEKGLRRDILDTYYLGSILTLYSGQWVDYDNVSWFEYWLRTYGFPNVFHEEQRHHNDPGNFYSIGY